MPVIGLSVLFIHICIYLNPNGIVLCILFALMLVFIAHNWRILCWCKWCSLIGAVFYIALKLLSVVLFVVRCVGQACSAASLLLAAGAPGMRHSLPNSRIMIHQPSGGAQVITLKKAMSFLNILLHYCSEMQISLRCQSGWVY